MRQFEIRLAVRIFAKPEPIVKQADDVELVVEVVLLI
jgi:hypothetical protein